MEKYLQQQKTELIKVVLFGPESTGKTSLAIQLAKHFKTVYVKEFAREFLQNKLAKQNKICEVHDLIPIAIGQMKSENELTKKANDVLFCDTDLLTTATYSRLYFDNFCDPIIDEYSKKNKYDLYLLLDVDVPWVHDDLRDRPNDRKLFFENFKQALIKNHKPFKLISGNYGERLKKSINFVNEIIVK